MSSVSLLSEKQLTAEEYLALAPDSRLTELVMGRVVELNQPETRHGFYCANIAAALRAAIKGKGLGRVVTNDSGVVTRRTPDSVRGGDVLFYSYAIVPKGPLPPGYWPAPELVFEVKSQSDRWVKVIAKVQEYLEASVRVVIVADPVEQRAHVYAPDLAPFVVEESGALNLDNMLPDVLPGCTLQVKDFFEE